jgi:transketolase
MPSMELFENTSSDYKANVLPPEVSDRIVVEAGISIGWERYAGEKGVIMAINCFGASAPGGTLMKNYGFTADNIAQNAMKLLQK